MGRRYNHLKRVRFYSQYVPFITAGLMLVVLIGVVAVVRHSQSPLPKSIAKQVDFTTYYPSKEWKVAASDITYDSKAEVLAYRIKKGDNTIAMNQQPTPTQFTDIPQYYPTLLIKLHEYESVGTTNGTVHLTRPQELNGKTSAVLSNEGTLVFAQSNTTMSSKDWRQFFNALKTVN